MIDDIPAPARIGPDDAERRRAWLWFRLRGATALEAVTLAKTHPHTDPTRPDAVRVLTRLRADLVPGGGP